MKTMPILACGETKRDARKGSGQTVMNVLDLTPFDAIVIAAAITQVDRRANFSVAVTCIRDGTVLVRYLRRLTSR